MCGVIGIIRKGEVAGEIFHGLQHLQHRGQDAAGILTFDPSENMVHLVKGTGQVGDVFQTESIIGLKGEWGIGHTRYTTSGDGGDLETQPWAAEDWQGRTVSIAFNGNLVNHYQLRQMLDQEFNFTSDSDAETLLKLLMHHLEPADSFFEALSGAVEKVFRQAHGAYSVVGLVQGEGIFAFRDPRGIRPLLSGRMQDGSGMAFCSETYPLSYLGYDQVTDVRPGEVVLIGPDLRMRRHVLQRTPHRHCSFEYVYFAKANAELEGQEVYRVRSELGRAIGRKVKKLGLKVDCVIGVPSTSQPAAMAAAWELGVRLEEGFLRKDNAGRSFIMPSQAVRERAVSHKLAPVTSIFRWNRVLIVDDSIVRGTVSRTIVRIAKQCEAKSVYFASTFPPIRHPCYYGVDMSTPDQLLANGRSYDEIGEAIGADCVIYNDVEDLKAAIGTEDICVACTNGEYPTSTDGVAQLQKLRKASLAKAEAEAAASCES